MRVLIEDYRNLIAGHCGSGAMRNLIYHYCRLDLDEAVVFGLGAGLDTVFFTADPVNPPFMLFGRGSSMEADLADTLGIDYSEIIDPDDDAAWQAVRQEIIAGRPTMLSGDIYYLDYRQFKVHFPAHRFVLLGFDDEREEVYVADRTDVETQTCSMAAVGLSRNPPDSVSTHNLWGKFHSATVRHSLPEACGRALGKTVERMQGLDTSQRDLMAAAQGTMGSVLAVGLEGLETFREQMQLWPERQNAADHARYVDSAIVKFGTGGGFFRDHFHAFMAWAKVQRPDLVTAADVTLAGRAADAWNGLSPTMQQLTSDAGDASLWQQADRQVQAILELERALFGRLADRVLHSAA